MAAQAHFLSCDVDLFVKLKICMLLDERKPTDRYQPCLELLGSELAADKFSEARRLSALLHQSGRYEYYTTCQLYADDGSPISLPARTKHVSFSTSEIKWSETLTLPIKYSDLPADAVAAITVWDVAGPLRVSVVGGTTVSLFDLSTMELRQGKMKLQLWPNCEADPSHDTRTPCEVCSPNDMDRLHGLEKHYDSGSIPHLEWLDRLAFQAIERTKKEIQQTDDRFFVEVEFPKLELPVLCFEKSYPMPTVALFGGARRNGQSKLLQDHKLALPGLDLTTNNPERNPVQIKHRVMSRVDQLYNKANDRELAPSREEKTEIARICQQTPIEPIVDTDQELIWRYRYYLSNHEMASLPKFCRTVQWKKENEVQEARELLNTGAIWKRTTSAVALELLTKQFEHPVPREFAVGCLDRAGDEELELYMPQLIQAMKYESDFLDFEQCHLERFLLKRSVALPIGNFMAWNLRLERGAKKYDQQYQAAYNRFEVYMATNPETQETWCELKKSFQKMEEFEAAFKEVRTCMKKNPKADLVKAEARKAFTATGKYAQLCKFERVVLPVDPRINIDGLIGSQLLVFKSAMLPVGIKFTCANQFGDVTKLPLCEPPRDAEENPLVKCPVVNVIWKTGDDLRQDSLIVQLFELMDKLLKDEAMDLKLTPYRIMPTSYEDGGAYLR